MHKRTLYLFFLALAILLGNCTSIEKYKVLSFFFDGVPDPTIIEKNTNSDTVLVADTLLVISNLTEKETVYVHYPYKELECGSCHDEKKKGAICCRIA